MTSISVCIPWRSDDPSRIAAWRACERAWKTSGLDYVAASDEQTGPFARARAINNAAAHSFGNVIVIHGADQLPDLAAIEDAAWDAEVFGWAFVYSRVQMFSPEQTQAYIELDVLPSVEAHPPHDYLCPGLLAVRRDLWATVGGMDERFGTGYGYEDCALRNRLASVAGTGALGRAQGLLRSLWHPHAGDPDPANHDLFWREYANLAPELN